MLSFDLTFVWTAVNLVVLFIFLRAVLFKRVTAFMDARSARVEGDMKQAADAKAEGERSREEYAALVKNATTERARTLEAARQKADAMYGEAVAKAHAEAERIIAEANAQAEQDRERAMSRMRNEIVSLALAAASKVMEANMDSDKNRKIVDEMLDSVEHGGGAA